MVTTLSSLQKYQAVFSNEGVELDLLSKSTDDKVRTESIIVQINPMNFLPTNHSNMLDKYTLKLINNGYNFILRDGDCDIGLLSIYANDYITKTAFTSMIGIIPTYRGGNLAAHLVKFALEFAKEVGMEKYRAEVHKENAKWLKFLLRYNFQIESETENNTYMIVNELSLSN